LAASILVDTFYPHRDGSDCVLEPFCGEGAFLRAIPAHVPALGVENSAELAAIALEASGREVIVADFTAVSGERARRHCDDLGRPAAKASYIG
jgi:site-specific DNA-methyltransferase (adenine-specific)